MPVANRKGLNFKRLANTGRLLLIHPPTLFDYLKTQKANNGLVAFEFVEFRHVLPNGIFARIEPISQPPQFNDCLRPINFPIHKNGRGYVVINLSALTEAYQDETGWVPFTFIPAPHHSHYSFARIEEAPHLARAPKELALSKGDHVRTEESGVTV